MELQNITAALEFDNFGNNSNYTSVSRNLYETIFRGFELKTGVIEFMFDAKMVKRHRLSGLANGALIGMGVSLISVGELFGLIFIAIGAGIEIWQRKRLLS